MREKDEQHVSERFIRLLCLHRRPDGSMWSGKGLEHATGGVVTRSCVANLERERIDHPGMDKLGHSLLRLTSARDSFGPCGPRCRAGHVHVERVYGGRSTGGSAGYFAV